MVNHISDIIIFKNVPFGTGKFGKFDFGFQKNCRHCCQCQSRLTAAADCAAADSASKFQILEH